MLYRNAVRTLGDLISPRALERLIEAAAQERHLDVDRLSPADLSDILKRDVFRRLQLTVPAYLAKRRIEEVLSELKGQAVLDVNRDLTQTQFQSVVQDAQRAQVSGLEETLRSYTLYFEWPEVKRLRALIGVLQGELGAGKLPPPKLLDEGEELRESLGRRLSEALVMQEGDLADLRAEFGRLEGVGGPKVRRLGTLINGIEKAQKEGTLASAEMERARILALELGKSVASSVIDGLIAPGTGIQASDPSVQRLRELDLAHEKRALSDVARDFAALLRVSAALELRLQAARSALDGGQLFGEERFSQLRADLEAGQRDQVGAQLSELALFDTRLSLLDPHLSAVEKARLNAAVARGILESGSLATDELSLLRQGVPILERAGESAEEALESQRELLEIEQAARDLPVIEGLQHDLAGASQALERGEAADLSALWAVIEQRRGQAAHEREGFDKRARQVLSEYDDYRHLAGETILRLGRLADTLRAHLALSKLSAEGRAHYVQVLTEAESLLSEARAEFQTAREVTSQFGEDALAGLLDVFSFEESSAELPAAVPLPEGLWEMQGGSVLRGAPDPSAWALARLSALLAELPSGLGAAQVSLHTSQATWLLNPHAGGHRVARGSNDQEARARLQAFDDLK